MGARAAGVSLVMAAVVFQLGAGRAIDAISHSLLELAWDSLSK